MNTITLRPDQITVDEQRLQMRATTDQDAIVRLAADMLASGYDARKPVVVFAEGKTWLLIDGFHRLAAAKSARIAKVPAQVFEGTLDDAIAYGILMNRDHGRQLEYPADFKHAASKLRAQGRSYNQIAICLWPQVKLRKHKTGYLIHPKSTSVQTWVNPHTGKAVANGVKTATAQAVRSAAKAAGLGLAAPAQDQLDAYVKAQAEKASAGINDMDRLKLKMGALQAENRNLLRALEEEERTRATILELDQLVPNPPKWLQTKATVDAPGVPMTIWSDWHYGERVFADQVGGVNQFNRTIGKKRIEALVEKTIQLTMTYMVKPQYPGIVVCLGGDMITGDIHEELRETNEGTVQESLLEVEEHLIAALSRMADVFKNVFVPCVVGNHGRDTLKPRAKHRAFTSHEWLMYRRLARHFKGDKRLLFQVPVETDAFFKVYDHRFLLTHGDALGVKGGDGIIGMLGPVARGTMKIGRSEAQIGRDIDTVIMGHWHTYVPRSDACHAIVNGALKGYDEYAKVFLRAPYSRPSQALWFIHPTYGITCQWPVFLDSHRQSAQTGKWVSFEQQREDR